MPENVMVDNSKRKFKYVVSKVPADERKQIADKLNEFAGHGYRVINQREWDGDLYITFERPFTAEVAAPAEAEAA